MNKFERSDDLGFGGFHLWQDTREFCFGVDAVLLSGFAEIKKDDRVLDLCSGNGIIPVLIAGKTEAKSITGLEINPVQVKLAGRSIEENGLRNTNVIEGNIKDAPDILGSECFDVVTCNPPYMKDGGLQNPAYNLAIARHEILCTLEDVLIAARAMLRYGGRFYMVHRPDRLAEIMTTMQKCGIEPKKLRMVHARKEKEASLVLIAGAKGGGSFLRVLPPLILYRADGTYTEEAHTFYEGKRI